MPLSEFIPENMSRSEAFQRLRHLEEIPVVCNSCEKEVTFGKIVSHHFRLHSPVHFVCKHCDSRFEKAAQLQAHSKKSSCPDALDGINHGELQ